MKTIIYIFLGLFLLGQPCQSFAIIGHHAPLPTKTVVSKDSKKSKFGAAAPISDTWSEVIFLGIIISSVLMLIIGLILKNWWLILLGGLGVSLILLFIYALMHIAFRIQRKG
jgi:hypothetical protein